MKRSIRYCTLLTLAAAVLTISCSTESSQNQPVTSTTNSSTSSASPAQEASNRNNAFVRIVHAVPGARAVDIFVDDTKVFADAAYKSVTPYKELSNDRHMFRVRPAGQDSTQPMTESNQSFSSGNHYTIVALPSDATGKAVTLKIIDDNIVPPSSGKAKLRVIHAAADAGEVSVYAQGKDDALFDGVNYQSITSYAEIDPMTVTLEVRPEDQNQAILMMPNARFEADHLYSIIVVGKAKGAPRLEVIKVEDKLGDTVSSAIKQE